MDGLADVDGRTEVYDRKAANPLIGKRFWKTAKNTECNKVGQERWALPTALLIFELSNAWAAFFCIPK